MSDTPAPPQTDYPYAPRLPVGPLLEDPSPPISSFSRWAERLGFFPDWQPDQDFEPTDEWTIVTGQSIPVVPFPLIAICALAVINSVPFVLMSVFEPPSADWLVIVIFAPLGGIMAGEFTVFAFALVWSQGSFLLRLLVHWFLAFALYSCWATGSLIASSLGGGASVEFVGQVLLALPAICLAVQAPLWCLCIYGGWKLENPTAATWPARKTVLIREILFGTALAAISLTALRILHHNLKSAGNEFWAQWAIGLLVLMLISFFTVAPLLRLILGEKSRMLAALGVCAYWIFLNALVCAGTWYFNPGDWRAITLCVSLMTLTGFVTTSIPLALVRSAGYRLRIGK